MSHGQNPNRIIPDEIRDGFTKTLPFLYRFSVFAELSPGAGTKPLAAKRRKSTESLSENCGQEHGAGKLREPAGKDACATLVPRDVTQNRDGFCANGAN
jgi:hypothetical protein